MNTSDLGFHHKYVAAKDTRAPTLLLLHGTGGTEDDLLELGRHLLPQAALLSPRGAVSENGMARFFRRIAAGVFDLDDLRLQTRNLAQFVEDAAKSYGFEAETVVAVGYSNGANIAASLLLLHPHVFAGAILFHAMVPIVPQSLPDLAGVPVFMASGRRDTMIPPAQSEELARLLRASGAEVTLHWEQGGHSLTMEEVDAATEWLGKKRLSVTSGKT